MTREEHLQFCTVCQNRKFDSQLGLVCGLTNQLADFESSCEHYSEDLELKAKREAEQVNKNILFNTASLSKRFINYLLDTVLFVIFGVVLIVLFQFLLAIVSPSLLSVFQEENVLLNYAMAYTVITIYYVIFEYSTGRSVAKFITKTKVVNMQGEQPGFRTIFIRTLCRFIPFEAFSFLGESKTGWHDTLSKTRVINA